jgi:hypothetical protein
MIDCRWLSILMNSASVCTGSLCAAGFLRNVVPDLIRCLNCKFQCSFSCTSPTAVRSAWSAHPTRCRRGIFGLHIISFSLIESTLDRELSYKDFLGEKGAAQGHNRPPSPPGPNNVGGCCHHGMPSSWCCGARSLSKGGLILECPNIRKARLSLGTFPRVTHGKGAVVLFHGRRYACFLFVKMDKLNTIGPTSNHQLHAQHCI